MKKLFALFSLLLGFGTINAQQFTCVLTDSTEARYIDRYNIRYTRHRQFLTDDNQIVHCDTQYVSNDYKFIEPWEPQCELPVRSAVYTLIVPIGYEYTLEQQGDCGINSYKPDTLVINTANGSHFKVSSRKFEARNIQPFVKDKYIYSASDYRYKLFPIISSIENVNGRIEEMNMTWEIVDHKLLNTPLVEQFYKTDNPIGLRASVLKSEGQLVYPVVLRRRSSGKLSLVKYPSAEAFDAIILAIYNGKDYDFIDPMQPDSLQHLLPEEYRVTNARLLEVKDNEVVGQWVNLFTTSDYRILTNNNMTIGPDALLHSENNTYYRNLAGIVEGRQFDHISTDIQLQFDGDSISFCPYMNIHQYEWPDSTRTLPIEFPYCVNERYNFVIKIDDSFRIDSYPESGVYYSATGAYMCQFKVLVEEQKISIIYILQRNVLVQLPSAHEYAIQFYQMLDEKFKECIVLRRKD